MQTSIEALEKRAYFAVVIDGLDPDALGDGPAAQVVDLTVAIDTMPTAVVNGPKAKGKATAILSNAGPDPFSGRTTVRLLASTDTVIDGGDVEVASVNKNFKLQPLASKTVKFKLGLAGLADNSYRLIAQVVPPSTAADQNALNNEVASTTTMEVAAPFVDLKLEYFSTQSEIFRGIVATTTFQVTNVGTAPFAGQVVLDMTLLPPDPLFPSHSIDTGGLFSLKLKANGKKLVRINYDMTAPLGPYSQSTVLLGANDRNPVNDEAVIQVQVNNLFVD